MFRFRRQVLISGYAVLTLLLGTGAGQATQILYNGFADTTGLTFAGDASTVVSSDGTVARVTPALADQSGAFYSTTPVTLGSNDTFSTQFQFRFTNPGGVDPADGITFVLAASPNGLGGSGNGIGYVGVGNSVAIDFGTYNNYLGLGPYTNAPNSSNHVGFDVDGVRSQIDVTNVYGVGSCGFAGGTPAQSSNGAKGCMSNGDLWTAKITYNGSNLTVTLDDPSEGAVFTAISDPSINIASYLGTDTAYVGFTSGTGAGNENHDIVDWDFSNTAVLPGAPEPSTWAMILFGFASLGFAGYRRGRAGQKTLPSQR